MPPAIVIFVWNIYAVQRPVPDIGINVPFLNLFLLVGSWQSFRGLVLIFCLSRSNLFAQTPFGYFECKNHIGRVLDPTSLFFPTSFYMKKFSIDRFWNLCLCTGGTRGLHHSSLPLPAAQTQGLYNSYTFWICIRACGVYSRTYVGWVPLSGSELDPLVKQELTITWAERDRWRFAAFLGLLHKLIIKSSFCLKTMKQWPYLLHSIFMVILLLLSF